MVVKLSLLVMFSKKKIIGVRRKGNILLKKAFRFFTGMCLETDV